MLGRGTLRNTVMVWFPQTDIEHAMQDEIDTLRAERDKLKAEATCFFEEGIKRGADNAKLKEESGAA
jgi:hypothetical protein